MLFKELYELYWRRHAAKLKEPRNVQYWWSAYKAKWSEVPVEAITRGAVQDWADELAERSASSSRRAVHQLSAIHNWGAKRGYYQCPNPCRGIELSQALLAWLLAKSPVMLPIPGTSKLAHLEANVAAARIALDAAEMQRIGK